MSHRLPSSSAKPLHLGSASRALWASVAVELGVAIAVGLGWFGIPTALAFHAGVSLLLLRWAWQVRRQAVGRWAVPIAVATTVFGPFGAAGTLLTLAIVFSTSASARTFEEWYADLFPEDVPDPTEEACDRLAAGRDLMPETAAIDSYWDVLAHGRIEQQLTAVALMSRHYCPAFAPVLLHALHRGAPSVRVQAASAVAHVEEMANQRLARLTANLDSGQDEFVAWLALARHHDDYAHCGLLDGERERQSRLKALSAYHRCLGLRPEDQTVMTLLARCLLRNGDVVGAVELLEGQPVTGDGVWRGHFWYGECLFRLHRLNDLDSVMAEMPVPANADEQLPAALPLVQAMWGARPKVEELPA